MKIGANTITNCKIGSTQVNEVRIGGTLVWSAFDADAQLFITNAGITDTTQQNAVNNLVVALKGYGIWSKMKALYPFVGGTASQHKFNLKNPLDTDAAFRLVFNGGWTHSNDGITGNGTNAFANSFFNLQFLLQNNSHLSIYQKNNYTPSAAGCFDIGAYLETGINTSGAFIGTKVVGTLSRSRMFFNAMDFNLTDNKGYFLANTNSINSKYYKDSILKSTVSNSGVFPLDSRNIYIGAMNGSTQTYFAPGKYALASIGDGLTDTEATNFYTAVQNFQVTLNRQV